MCANAFGETGTRLTEQEIREELPNYGITVSPMSFRAGFGAYDFLYIDDNTIIRPTGFGLIIFNLLTNEQKRIEVPEEWTISEGYGLGWEKGSEKRFEGLRELSYDRITNTVHTLFRYRDLNNKVRMSYQILNLENCAWEAIEELGNEINKYWYDSENMLIYVQQVIRFENELGLSRIAYFITTYDLRKREIIASVELNDVHFVYHIYGNPPKILASTSSGGLHFFVYNIASKTLTDYPKSSIGGSDSIFSNLAYYIPFSEDGCFLAIEMKREYKSGVVLIDLKTNTRETVLLDDFPYEIYNFKQVSEGRYGFMVGTRTWTGARGQSFLCFLDYPK